MTPKTLSRLSQHQICELREISVRTANTLQAHGIYSVLDLLNTDPEAMMGWANFGKVALSECRIASINHLRAVGAEVCKG